MKLKQIISLFLLILIVVACKNQEKMVSGNTCSLKDAVNGKFTMGVAMNEKQITGADTAAVRIIKQHFNSIVAENCMKSSVIHPEEERYDFTQADQLVQFGEDNGMEIIGHCLIWHTQLAPWFCVDENGNNVTPEVLKKRMKDHITTVMTHYKGRVHGWDVVNEAFLEDGSYRNTKFYEILGEDYIPLAFEYAHQADPDAELYYNDYGMNVEGRRNAVVQLVRELKKKGLCISGVGMQGHMGMDYPKLADFEKSIEAFGAEGVNVMITEWDMSALSTVKQSANVADTVAYQQALNPYPESLPDSVSKIWNERMKAFFELFEKHADVISRVTVWGVADEDSWKNNFPVSGRRDYPLLFDRNYQPKPFVKEILDKNSVNTKRE